MGFEWIEVAVRVLFVQGELIYFIRSRRIHLIHRLRVEFLPIILEEKKYFILLLIELLIYLEFYSLHSLLFTILPLQSLISVLTLLSRQAKQSHLIILYLIPLLGCYLCATKLLEFIELIACLILKAIFRLSVDLTQFLY